MKIGILETGLIRDELAHQYAPYPVMFESLLRRSGRALEFEAFSPVRGQMPGSTRDCDGWLITGSRHGVYEALDWMAPLQSFIRDIAEAQSPLIGVCFGHQIIAAALGGTVEKSELGWQVGLKHYQLEKTYDWMPEKPPSVAIHAWHQDQVIVCPADAEVFLTAPMCAYAGLAYGDSVISVQAHPEIEADYELALLELFSGNLLPEDVAADAIDSVKNGSGPDTRLLSDWFAEFFLSRAG